jgi:hypothetical protein
LPFLSCQRRGEGGGRPQLDEFSTPARIDMRDARRRAAPMRDRAHLLRGRRGLARAWECSCGVMMLSVIVIWGESEWGRSRRGCSCEGGRRARRILSVGLHAQCVRHLCVRILRLERVRCVVQGCAVGLGDVCSVQMFPDRRSRGACETICQLSSEDAGSFTIVKEGRYATEKSRCRRCGHATTMEGKTEPLSYPSRSREK